MSTLVIISFSILILFVSIVLVALMINFFKSLRGKFPNTNQASKTENEQLSSQKTSSQETVAQIKEDLKPEQIMQSLLPGILSEINNNALNKDLKQNTKDVFLKGVNSSGLLSKNEKDKNKNEQSLIFSCEGRDNNAEFKFKKDSKEYNVKVSGNMKVVSLQENYKYDGKRLWKNEDCKNSGTLKDIKINQGTIWSFDLVVELQYKNQKGELKTFQKRCEYNILNNDLNIFQDFNKLNVNSLTEVSFIEYKEEVKSTNKLNISPTQADSGINNNTPSNKNRNMDQEKGGATKTEISTRQKNTTTSETKRTVFKISLEDPKDYLENHTNMGGLSNEGALRGALKNNGGGRPDKI